MPQNDRVGDVVFIARHPDVSVMENYLSEFGQAARLGSGVGRLVAR